MCVYFWKWCRSARRVPSERGALLHRTLHYVHCNNNERKNVGFYVGFLLNSLFESCIWDDFLQIINFLSIFSFKYYQILTRYVCPIFEKWLKLKRRHFHQIIGLENTMDTLRGDTVILTDEFLEQYYTSAHCGDTCAEKLMTKLRQCNVCHNGNINKALVHVIDTQRRYSWSELSDIAISRMMCSLSKKVHNG